MYIQMDGRTVQINRYVYIDRWTYGSDRQIWTYGADRQIDGWMVQIDRLMDGWLDGYNV